jgi:hypothetical protein
MFLIQQYGPEWLVWETETLELMIRDSNRYEVSSLNLSKIQAVKTLHMVDSYWQRWEVFVWCTMPVAGVLPDFDIMQVPTVLQCMMAVHTANSIRTDVAWTDEVKIFMAQVHRHDEILVPQKPLEFVDMDLDGDYPVDLVEVKDRWPQVANTKKPPKEDTAEDEQLRRMLDVRSDFSDFTTETARQLEVLFNV